MTCCGFGFAVLAWIGICRAKRKKIQKEMKEVDEVMDAEENDKTTEEDPNAIELEIQTKTK